MPTPATTSCDPINTRYIVKLRIVSPILLTMKIICCVCLMVALSAAAPAPAPADGFVFPDERRQRKLEPVITPPVLPVLEHLERDPSTLLPHERNFKRGQVKPKFGFGGGFNVAPSGTGGLTASISSSASGGGASHSASQSFSFGGFNEGFSASHSASQASSFNGFGSGFSGSQAASQAASFGSNGVSGAASSAAAFGGGGGGGSQSASQAFGFNSLNGFQPESTFGEGIFDVRHRGIPDFPIPSFGRSKGVGAAAFRSGKAGFSSDDDFISILVSD